MKKIGLFVSITLLMFNNAIAEDKPFNAYFDSVTPFMSDSETIVFDGIRVDGFGYSSLKDALRLEYRFDYKTLNFILNTDPGKITTYSNVGIFNEEHMAIDVSPAQPDFKANGLMYHSGETNSFEATAAQPFVAEFDLKAGHVMSWLINQPSNDFSYQFSDTSVDANFLGTASQGVISDAHKILTKCVF
ncbi:MAG: hypothetical protein NTV00_03615 [Methylococcales bacterium]|nr:hypothetical protein [Methylococcales bacterium]